MNSLVDSVTAAANSIRHKISEVADNTVADKIDGALVLGSGLSGLTLDGYETLIRINYSDIDGLPRTTAPTHIGEINIVSNGKKSIALCSGRHHLYEGYSAQEVSTLVYTLANLGARKLILTNAAGALNPSYRPGDVMLIEDHINFTGHNPIRGQGESFGSLFPDMSKAYHPEYIARALNAAELCDVSLHQGVYIGVLGPSLETSAERRMMRGFGADAVGMSTVLESIAANQCGMQVLGLSAITNMAVGNEEQQADTIEEVLENAAIAGRGIAKILNELSR